MNAQLQNTIKVNGFKKAVRELLSGEITGHLGPYMYIDDQDDHRWKEGHSAPSYYLGREDKASFDLVLADLDTQADNFIDLGPGGEEAVIAKSVPLMHRLHALNYYPVDLSPALAGQALVTMQKATGARGVPIIADFFELMPIKPLKSLIAIIGGTIANFETHKDLDKLQQRLSGIFSGFRKAVINDSYFLVGFDANNNAREVIDCYTSPQFDRLVRSSMDRAIDTSGFSYEAVWTPHNHQLALGLRADRDQIVHFDNEEFAFEKSEFLPVLNSYRFPVKFLQNAAAQAGWQHQRTWSASGRTHYMLFKCAP